MSGGDQRRGCAEDPKHTSPLLFLFLVWEQHNWTAGFVHYFFTPVPFLSLPPSLVSIFVGDEEFLTIWLIFFLNFGATLMHLDCCWAHLHLKNEIGASLAHKPGGQLTGEEQKASSDLSAQVPFWCLWADKKCCGRSGPLENQVWHHLASCP